MNEIEDFVRRGQAAQAAADDVIRKHAKQDQQYWIWSNEHRAWWGPNHRGYVTNLSEAGTYPASLAEKILADANIVQEDMAWLMRDEVAIPARYLGEKDQPPSVP